NRRSEERADEMLAKHGIPIIGELDTRALVRHLRHHGAMRGIISSLDLDEASLVAKAKAIPAMAGLDLASKVSTPDSFEWNEGLVPCSPSDLVTQAEESKYHVVAYDFGIKHNILRCLVNIGSRVTVVP